MSDALVPELAVSDCAASLAFDRDLLGFTVRYQRPEEGFAYLALGEAELMLDEIGKGRTFDHATLRARPFGRGLNLHIRVAHLTPLLATLRRHRIPLPLEPEEKWYRRYAFEPASASSSSPTLTATCCASARILASAPPDDFARPPRLRLHADRYSGPGGAPAPLVLLPSGLAALGRRRRPQAAPEPIRLTD